MNSLHRPSISDGTIERLSRHARVIPNMSIDALVNAALDVLEKKRRGQV